MGKKKEVVNVSNSTILARGTYTSTLAKIQSDGQCPFCSNALFKHHKKPILKRGAYWLSTLNNWPYEGSKHHFLLIARAHVERIEDLTAPMWAELQKHIQFLSKKYEFTGGTFMLRTGDTSRTGATVHHLHAHFIVGGKRKPNSEELRAVVGFKK